LAVLAIIALARFSDTLDDYNYIIENWKSPVIVDIKGIPPSQECSSIGPDYAIMNYYNWPGTKGGCDCRYEVRKRILLDPSESILRRVTPKSKIYDNHECNSTQLSYGCINVKS
jgi:hypothetical protein